MNKEKPRRSYKKELEERDKLLNEYKEQIQRLQAEFENYIKRNEKERKDVSDYASKDILLKLVNIYEDFQRALNVSNECEKKELIDGVKMIFDNFENVLKEEGVSEIKCIGEKFNPYRHEVLEKVEHEEADGKILEELQKGYMLKDKILRFSKVRVSGGKKNE